MAFHVVAAVRRCILTHFVDFDVASVCIGILLRRQGLAFENLIPAAGFGAIEVVNCLIVEGLVDGLDPVRVVVCDFGVGQFLFQKIYAAIDYA